MRYLGSRSPLALMTAWQHGRNSFANTSKPVPPRAAKSDEFMRSAMRLPLTDASTKGGAL